MARGKKSKSQQTWSTTFVRCELTTPQKAEFKKWVSSKDVDLTSLVNEILQTNHKVSFSYSENNDSYIVSITGKQEDCDNANKCVTSHAKDYVTALYLAAYKYHVIFRGEPWEDIGETEDFG